MSDNEVTEAVQAAESEGLAAVAEVQEEAPIVKNRILAAIAGLEQHLQTLEDEVEAFTVHERTAVAQYVLALKTRVHSLLLRL